MQLLCIDDAEQHGLVAYQVYTRIKEYDLFGMRVVTVVGLSSPYDRARFVEIDGDIDETELVKEREDTYA